jgi:DNA-3-methyladenine glycosylase I
VDLNNPLYVDYHDNEWGVPVHNDDQLFEMLILEGAQAGLSWATVLKKREAYRKLFLNFDPKKVAEFSDLDLERILEDASIIRNRLKIFSVRQNAKVFLKIQSEYGSFDEYIWKWTAT